MKHLFQIVCNDKWRRRQLIVHISVRLAALVVFATAVLVVSGPLEAQSERPVVPGFWRIDKYQARPAFPKDTRLRFVTTTDYPPFNYRDDTGNLTGFNVEIARAICGELKLKCTFSTMRWDRLVPAVERGRADAIIASLALTAKSRRKLSFSYRYYRTPARFVIRLESEIVKISPSSLDGRKIAVVKGTAHEAYLKAFFKDSEVVGFENAKVAREAIRSGKADVLFGDGISLIYWLGGTSSRNCCRFIGGPYTEAAFFGEGVAIAVRKGNHRLVDALNSGLVAIRNRGTFENIYLRYFPTRLY